MAGFDYNKMKVTADSLLNRFSQGVIEYESVGVIPPANSWEEPTEVTTRTRIDAVAGGVSQEFVDGVAILSTDLQVIASSPVPVGGRILIDGVHHVVVRHDKIPAAGVTVAHRYIVR